MEEVEVLPTDPEIFVLIVVYIAGAGDATSGVESRVRFCSRIHSTRSIEWSVPKRASPTNAAALISRGHHEIDEGVSIDIEVDYGIPDRSIRCATLET